MKKAGIFLLIIALGVLAYFWYFPYPVKQSYPLSKLPKTFTIDLETQDRNYVLSSSSEIKAPAIGLVTEVSRSGKFSQKLTVDQRFGMGIEISGVGFLDQLVATAWVHEDSEGAVLAFISDHRLYKGCFETGKTDGPWKEVKSIFLLDIEVLDQDVTVYCWLPYDHEGPAWVDDLTVNLIDDATHVWPQFNSPDYELNVAENTRAKLQEFRDTALARGVLLPTEKKWFDAELNGGKAKIKLKGDWTDHLQGPKWSFRIKDKNNIDGMPLYSLQSPATRNMLAEWVVHQAYESVGVLTTEYSFVRGRFNHEFDGVYAKEEHFGLDFTRRRGLPDGPIVKYDEGPLWETRAIQRTRKTSHPYALAARVEAYDDDYWIEDTTPQRDHAMSQLFLHQHNYAPADILIDVDQMAKYLAIAELFQASHSYIWHNQRFYHNPEKGLLEPIAYDNCPVIDTLKLKQLESVEDLFQKNLMRHSSLNLRQSSDFVDAYLNYLQEFSSREWQENFWNSIEAEIKQQQALLNAEYPGYQFDPTMVWQNAEQISDLLRPPIDTLELKANLANSWIKPFSPQKHETAPENYVSCNCYRTSTRLDASFFGHEIQNKLVCNSFFHKPLYFENGTSAAYIKPYSPKEPLKWTIAPFLPNEDVKFIELWDLETGTSFKARILDFLPDGAFLPFPRLEEDQLPTVEFSSKS